MRRVVFVVAADAGGVIGRQGGLPWHCPEDLAWFREVTMGKALVMGRRTWDSIGRPLPGRDSVVLTRDPGWNTHGAHTAYTLAEALALAERLRPGADEVAVVGGAEVFAQALPLADRIYWTDIPGRHKGDTRFPEVDWSGWREVWRRHGASGAVLRLLERDPPRPAAGEEQADYSKLILGPFLAPPPWITWIFSHTLAAISR